MSGQRIFMIFSEEALALEQRVLPEHGDVAHGLPVTGTFASGHLIGRCAAPPDDRVTAEPRHLVYVGFDLTPETGLTAHLFAQIPIERQVWEDDEDTPEFELVPLGVLVRVPQELKGLDRQAEFIDHFKEVVCGNATTVIERMLPHL